MSLFPARHRAARRHAARPALVSLLACALLAAPAAAQSLAGRVAKDGAGLAGVSVTLHRVTRESPGAIGQATTGAGGAFSFRLPQADSAAGFTVFLVTAEVGGVRYFGPAISAGDPSNGYEVTVYDTTSSRAAADSVRVGRRDVFLFPGEDGGWEAAELVRLVNPGGRTVLGAPVALAVPRGISAFDGRVGAEAGGEADVALAEGRAAFSGPLIPGARDYVFRYRLAPEDGRLAYRVDRATDTLNLFVRTPSPPVRVEGLVPAGGFEAEGERFVRFSATGLPAGRSVAVAIGEAGGGTVDPRLAALGVAGAVLAAGAFVARRRSPAA